MSMKQSEIKAHCKIGDNPSLADLAFVSRMVDKAELEDVTELSLFKEWSAEQGGRAASALKSAELATATAKANLIEQQLLAAQAQADQKLADSVKTGGNKAPRETPKKSGDAGAIGLHAFQVAVREHMTVYQCSEQQATREVANSHPSLVQSYVLAGNPGANKVYAGPHGLSVDTRDDD